MTAIARDAVASDHLVYAWPFPLGPECEVTCAEDEQVVMCPSWMVGDRLGPGRHRWRTPDPMRPVTAFFVLTSPVDATFDLTTAPFLLPSTGQPVRIRATGSCVVRCSDPTLLIAQLVGLPFDHINDGILRSVARSIERMLARLLIRRVVMAATPAAVTEPTMLPSILEELVAYNPAAGAVFGLELVHMGHIAIAADDGSTPFVVLPHHGHDDWNREHPSQPQISLVDTARGVGRLPSSPGLPLAPPPAPEPRAQRQVSGEIRSTQRGQATAGEDRNRQSASGEIVVRAKPSAHGSGPAQASPSEPTHSRDDITQPGGLRTYGLGGRRVGSEPSHEAHGAILGIGVGHIGEDPVSVPVNVAPGGRVLVPGPNGLMQSATVRQLLQGYYELEVGSSGETIWVPITGVVPEGF
jgi:hypothetical protein